MKRKYYIVAYDSGDKRKACLDYVKVMNDMCMISTIAGGHHYWAHKVDLSSCTQTGIITVELYTGVKIQIAYSNIASVTPCSLIYSEQSYNISEDIKGVIHYKKRHIIMVHRIYDDAIFGEHVLPISKEQISLVMPSTYRNILDDYYEMYLEPKDAIYRIFYTED